MKLKKYIPQKKTAGEKNFIFTVPIDQVSKKENGIIKEYMTGLNNLGLNTM